MYRRVENAPRCSIQIEEKVAPQPQSAMSVRSSCVYTSCTLQDPPAALLYPCVDVKAAHLYCHGCVKMEWQGA